MHRKAAAAKKLDKADCKEGEDSFKDEIQSRDVLDNELQLCSTINRRGGFIF